VYLSLLRFVMFSFFCLSDFFHSYSLGHLSELRALRKPPQAVVDVLGAVLTLLGERDLSWNSMKGFLGSPSVKEQVGVVTSVNYYMPLPSNTQLTLSSLLILPLFLLR
jgi:hypothetical protein